MCVSGIFDKFTQMSFLYASSRWSFHSKIMIYYTQKLLHKVNELPRNYNFTPYTNSESINTIPDDVVNHLSTDQKNCIHLREGLATGNLPPEIASIDCGWINSSKWLTTGRPL